MLHKNTVMKIGVTLLAITATACSNTATEAPAVKQTEAITQTVQSEVMALASGVFSGRSDHITTGQVTLEKTKTGYQLNFAADFSLDGAPDPVVAIGNNETFQVANKLGALKHKTGSQTYALPASFSPGQFAEVYVWCEKFSVPLGVATLKG